MREKKPKTKPNKKPPQKKKKSGGIVGKYVKFSLYTTIIMAACAVGIVKLSELGYVPSSFYYASRFIYCCVGGWFAGSLFIAFGMDSKSASAKREEEDSDEETEENDEETEQRVTKAKQKVKPDRRQKTDKKLGGRNKHVEEEDEEEEEEEEVENKFVHKPKTSSKKTVQKKTTPKKKKVVVEEEDEDDDYIIGQESEETQLPNQAAFEDLFGGYYDETPSGRKIINLHESVNLDGNSDLVEDKPTEIINLDEVKEEEQAPVVEEPVVDVEPKPEQLVEVIPPPIIPVEESEIYVKVVPPPITEPVTKASVSKPVTVPPVVETVEEVIEVESEPVMEEQYIEEPNQEEQEEHIEEVSDEVIEEPYDAPVEEESVEEEHLLKTNRAREITDKFSDIISATLPCIEYEITEEAQSGLIIEEGCTVLKCASVILDKTVYHRTTGCRGLTVPGGSQLICSYGIEFKKLNRKVDLSPLTRIEEISSLITLPDWEEILSLDTPICAIVSIPETRDVLFDDLSIMMDIHP